MDTTIAVIGTECKQSDTLSDGLNEEAWHEDETPHIDFCRRHLITCVIVGATSLIVVTATIITCAVLIGYKISKESISLQYGTVVFRTKDNSSVLEKITIHEDGLSDIQLPDKALVIFDYPHFLMVLHFAQFDGVCFVSQINDSWTHVFGLKKEYEEIQTASLPAVLWFTRTNAVVDKNLIPYSIHKTCWQNSYWMKGNNAIQSVSYGYILRTPPFTVELEKEIQVAVVTDHKSTDSHGKCDPTCVTFCLTRKTPCTKVCLQNPCTSVSVTETSRSRSRNNTNMDHYN